MKSILAILLIGLVLLAVTPGDSSISPPAETLPDSVQFNHQDLLSEKDAALDSILQQMEANTSYLRKSIRKKEKLEKLLEDFTQNQYGCTTEEFNN